MKIEIYGKVQPTNVSASAKLLVSIFRAARPFLPKRLAINVAISDAFLGDDVGVLITHEISPLINAASIPEDQQAALMVAIELVARKYLGKNGRANIEFAEVRKIGIRRKK